jgi:outer membrane protein OmpA-like peptidoglycan-associated protein/opacity protein-like surface antigen
MKITNILVGALITISLSVPAFGQDSDGPSTNDKEQERDPQHLRGWSIGVKGLYLYDLNSTVYDTEINTDLRGLNGDKPGLDFGFDLNLEKQFTPYFGLRADFRYRALSGAYEDEYYENSFYSGRLSGLFIWNNLNPRNVGSKWNFYTPIGFGVGNFNADRFLVLDDAPNGNLSENYSMVYSGAGIMYELSKNWRLDLEANYNVVRRDGFDGFDNGTGWDPYLSVGLGIAYTFGNKEKPAMYATNYFEAPYYNVAGQVEELAELEAQMEDLSEKQKKDVAELRENLELIGAVNTRQDESIKALSNRPKAQVINDTKEVATASTGYKAVVFFNFDSAVLSAKAQKDLLQKLAGVNGPFTIVGYTDKAGADSYNEKLRIRRAEAVQSFLINQMGYSADDIDLSAGEIAVEEQNDFLRRRVEIR